MFFQNEDKKMRAYAVIPPILLEERKRRYRYDNQNGILDDPVAEYKENKNINIWTLSEREAFRDKFLQHPKNFVMIAGYLERKSVADCVHYYYSSKKKENYKLMVKRRIRRPRKPNNQPIVEVVGVNSTGVTTRGSVAALQREQATRTVPCSSAGGSNQGEPSMMDGNSQVGHDEGVGSAETNWQGADPSSAPRSPRPMDSAISTSNGDVLPPPVAVSVTIAETPSGDAQSANVDTQSSTSEYPITSASQEVREKDKENLSVLR